MSASGATPRQLRHLIRLASKTGMTFTKPASSAEASTQIGLLQAKAASQRKTRLRPAPVVTPSEASARRQLSRNTRLINATRSTSGREPQ